MSQPLAVLDKTEKEIAALLVAGLATHRSGRERMQELAGEVSALKMERLAAELRKLAEEQDPKALANEALTALAMAGKIRERLASWPRVEADHTVTFATDPSVRVVMPEEPPADPDVATLVRWMETGDELLRAHAATLLVSRGEEAVPELARLARKGTVAVRRHAIETLGKIGGEAVLGLLVSLLGDVDCWQALLRAILPYGGTSVPLFEEVLASWPAKKGQERRQRMAASLLWRLEARSTFKGLWDKEDEDQVARGYGIATQMPSATPPGASNANAEMLQEVGRFLILSRMAIFQAETTGDIDHIVRYLDQLVVNEVRSAARQIGCGSRIEGQLSEHYLKALVGGTVKDRHRAASVLRGLASPSTVLPLVALLNTGEGDVSEISEILGEIGGSHAVGILLDLVQRTGATAAVKALMQLGDPDSAPALLEMLASSSKNSESAELPLVALGDAAVDLLAREMRAREGTPRAGQIQQMLLQINTPLAREALRGTDPDNPEALLGRLGHPKLGAQAAKALAKHGEAVLDRLEEKLRSSDPTASFNALEAIGSIKGERAYTIVRRVAAEAVGKARGFQSHDHRVVALLARYADPRSTPLLVQALASNAYFLQEEASKALVKAGTTAVPHLLPLLDDPLPDIRARALDILGKLECVDAEQRAIELLGDAIPQVRMAAARALGPIGAATGNPKVVEALGIALAKEQVFWMTDMIQSLGRIGGRQGLSHLRRLVQNAAARGLPRHIVKEAEEAIRKIEAFNPEPENKGLMGRLRHILGGT